MLFQLALLEEVVAPSFSIDASMFTGLISNIISMIPIVLVAGMAIFGAVKACKMVPKLIGSFIK